MRAKAAAALLSLLLAMPAVPQQKLVESIEVRVANVDVVVRDRAGNPVVGLTKDDFELYEDGIKQTITNLYEVRRDVAIASVPQAAPAAPEVPVELRQRRLLIFIDSASLQPATKKQVLGAAEKFVERMRPEDRAMLATWRLGLHVVTPFTNDPAELKRGFAEVDRYAQGGEASSTTVARLKSNMQRYIDLVLTSGSGPGRMTFEEAYEMVMRELDSYSENLLTQQGRMLQALDRLISNLAGLEGKKALLFVGAQLPSRPGAELYSYAYQLFVPHLTNPRSNRGITLDLQSLNGPAGNSRPREIEDLAKRASANGVAIYALNPTVIDSQLDAAESQVAVDYEESFSRNTNTASSLQTMAAVTGGVAITQTANYDLAFDTISKDLDSYYSLGYKPGEERNATGRRIVVKTKNPAYLVRARETFVLKSTDEQMNDKVVANLYTDAANSTWPISLKIGTPRNEGGKFLVPIQVIMPSTITLLPQDQSLVGGFKLFFVVGSADGKPSEVMTRPGQLKIPPSSEPLVRAKPMTYTTAIRVNGGESTLSVAAVDEISGAMGFARTKIAAR